MESTPQSSMNLTVEELQRSLQKFGVFDYVVFVFMLVGCSGIGLFFAMKTKRSQDVADEYLMGGRNMTVFPIAMSLVASFISGITLLGNPTEMYLYGSEYIFVSLSFLIAGPIASILFLPVFHDLKLSSTYEYLEVRFDKKVRLLGSILFSIALICWLPIVIYVPALAFNQVTGINVHIITPCVCIVCIFYTAIGGLKAVVWTDVVQTIMMIGGMFIIAIKGTNDIGGLKVLWDRNMQGERLEFPNFDFDFVDRHTIWGLTIAASIHFVQVAIINQNMVQRYMALPSLKHARRALWIFMAGIAFFLYICCYCGFLVYATYYDCDPLTTKLAKAKDQLLPLLVMRVLGDYHGMPGLFVAGIFSAALSSLSTGLNSMSAVVLQDFIKPFVKTKMSNGLINFIMKGVVLIFGAICVALVFVIEKLGNVLQLSVSLSSITVGPSLANFVGGMLIPWMNAKGTFYGGLLGLCTCGFVVIGAQNAIASKKLKFPMKPVTVEGCDYIFNASLATNMAISSDEDNYVFPLFRLSYIWFSFLGFIVTLIFQLIISCLTGLNDPSKTNPMHISPVIRKYLPRRKSILQKNEEEELIEILKKNKPMVEKNLDGV